MPTNLPPEYFEADRKFRKAESTSAKISSLEELIATIPKHKGTDKLRAELRRKLSKLRVDQQKKKSTGKHESEYHIEKEGAGRISIIGAPNVGKSSLLAALTHATPKISESPFTTWIPMPGMMIIEEIHIQLIDTPPLNKEHMEPEYYDILKSSDLLLLVVDLQATPFRQFEEALAILQEHKIAPVKMKNEIKEAKNFNFIPFIVVVNKDDDDKIDEDFEVFDELLESELPLIPISAANKRNLDKLSELVFEKLEVMRIYSKRPGYDADMSNPFVLKNGSTIEEFAEKVHKDFYQNLKTARVWGSDVYEGQLVGRDHILHDKDVVELHL
ncbi:MAG: TGS domain-containing protein [Ignavibacteriaceae bacterium]|nr:TGS domain-containing protein [Ignavibacteriaceae bacterium]